MSITYDPITGEPIENNDENGNITENINETVNTDAVVSGDVKDNEVQTPEVSPVEEADAIITSESSETGTESVSTVETIEEVPAVENTDIDITQSSEATGVADEISVSDTGNITEVPNDPALEDTKPVMNFDPITGERINKDAAPSGYSPIPAEKSYDDKKNLKYVTLAVAALLIVLCIVLVCVFSSKQKKVESAIRATFAHQSEISKVFNDLYAIEKSRHFTTNFTADIDEAGFVSGRIIMDGNDKQLVVDTDLNKLPEISFKMGIDSKYVYAEVPKISNSLFVYDYVHEKEGMLVDELGEETVSAIDTLLKNSYEGFDKTEHLQKELAKAFLKRVNELEFEKAETKSFKVDGKKVKCKAISVDLDRDFYMDIFDDAAEIYEEEYEEMAEDLGKYAGTSLADSFKEAKNEVKTWPDATVTFYIYRGKLAAVNVLSEGKKGFDVDVLFKGGDYRTQNVSILEDGDEIFAIEGSEKKDKEIYDISIDGEEAFSVEYNYKKGNLLVDYDHDNDKFLLDMDITSSSKSVEMRINDLSFDEESLGYITVTVEKGGSIEDYTNTELFDIGNASENDFMDLIRSIDIGSLTGLGDLFY